LRQSVVAYHAGFALVPGGFLGVDVFFVISGYLICRLINDEIKDGSFTVAAFYKRRVMRLFPALLHTWSLSVEEQFYIVCPLFMLACYRFCPKRLNALVATGALLSFAAAVRFHRPEPAVVQSGAIKRPPHRLNFAFVANRVRGHGGATQDLPEAVSRT
jgi:peptidoglycan/LPS O-acetylase OafA/YrhL